MDGQKRIWLRQIEHLSLPPYSNGDSGSPLQFVVLMSTESAVAPDEGDAGAVHAFAELVQEWHHHHKATTAAGGSADSSISSSNGHKNQQQQQQQQQRHYPRLAALNEYERRLLNIKLSDGNKGVEIKRAPMLGTTIGRSELGQPFNGRPSPLASDAPVEEVLRFVQSRFREHLAAFEEEVHSSGNSSERGVAADLSKLEPVWVRDVYLRMISLFDANQCSVSVRILFYWSSFLFYFAMSLSLSQSISACLYSLTLHDTSLTIIPHSINHQSTHTHITYYLTGTRKSPRIQPRFPHQGCGSLPAHTHSKRAPESVSGSGQCQRCGGGAV
jgi:hypothetical protein